MNTKKDSSGTVSRLQRTLLAVLVLIVLFGSFPVGGAQAASGASYSSIKCGIQSFDVNLVIQGAFDGQWVTYRLIILQANPDGSVSTVYTDWTPSFQVYAISKNWFTIYPYAVTNHTMISVVPEILYWNGISWENPGAVPGPHYEAYADSIQNFYPYCTVIAQ